MKDPFSRDNEQETAPRGDPADVAVRPLPLGHRLGELQLDEVLGIGGFGIVYRAFDRTLRRAVAIKEYMPSMLATRGGDYTVSLRSERFAQAFDAGRGAFLNEARLLAQFDHPGLVKVLHFWESHGTAYMVMPFYEGRTLKQLLDGGVQMSETQLRNVVAALLGALDTLHRAQCFHRDVALDNVLIRPDGSAILLDFGAARKRIGDLVDDGAMMIKPGYAPIEQYTDDPAFSQGPWTDLYALGAVMHAMITGELPPAAVVRSIKDTYRPLATRELPVGDLYSPAFLAAVDHALQLRIADRPESVAAFAAELGLREFARPGYGAAAVAPASPAPLRSAADDEDAARASGAEPESPEPQSPGSRLPGAGRESPQRQTGEEQKGESASGPSDPDSARDEPISIGDEDMALPAGSPALAPQPQPQAQPQAQPQSQPRATSPAPDVPRNRRVPVYVGGALAALVVIGIGTAYFATPARNAGTPASSASQPQAAAPGSAPGTSLAQRGPTPIVVPPSSLPAAQAAHGPAAAAAMPASGSATALAVPAPQVARTDGGTAPPAAMPGSSLAPAASLDASERVVTVPPSDLAAAQPAPSAAAATPDGVSAVSAEQRPPDTPETVAVRFHVRPWGDIYVSGVRRGASPPLRSVSLTPGTYQIEIRNGSLPPLRRTVRIDPGSRPISIDYAFE